jgi:hypothetical protein
LWLLRNRAVVCSMIASTIERIHFAISSSSCVDFFAAPPPGICVMLVMLFLLVIPVPLVFLVPVHSRLHRLRPKATLDNTLASGVGVSPQGVSSADPMDVVTAELMEEGWLLCFDEFQVQPTHHHHRLPCPQIRCLLHDLTAVMTVLKSRSTWRTNAEPPRPVNPYLFLLVPSHLVLVPGSNQSLMFSLNVCQIIRHTNLQTHALTFMYEHCAQYRLLT